MSQWFLANTMLSLLAFFFLACNGNSPYRLRFHVCFAVLCAWLVPWQYFTGFFGAIAPVQPFELAPWFVLPESTITQTAAFTPWGWLQEKGGVLLLSAFALGLCLFIRNLVRHVRFLHELEDTSCDGDYLWKSADPAPGRRLARIRIQDTLPGAWNSGVFKPIIWVNRNLVDTPDLPAVLLHESTHIKKRDNFYLCIITFIENLFWWNPLIFFLGRIARDTQELACDELCARGDPDYKLMLNNLILTLCPPAVTANLSPLDSGIFQHQNFNVKRIHALQRSYTMKLRHYLSIACLIIFSLTSIGFVSAQDEGKTRQQTIQAVKEKRASDPDYVPSDKEIIAGLEEYVAKMDDAYVKLRQENESLRRQIEELERKAADR